MLSVSPGRRTRIVAVMLPRGTVQSGSKQATLVAPCSGNGDLWEKGDVVETTLAFGSDDFVYLWKPDNCNVVLCELRIGVS